MWKNFFKKLMSDSDAVSTKRFVGLISLIMIVAYGVKGLLLKQFNVEFSIFYISVLSVTMWIGFKFMSADKILKYRVFDKLSLFSKNKEVVPEQVLETETPVEPEKPEEHVG